ncbi:MAG: hypothetical protein WAV23_01890 [Minisyncoccia bacterium]
MEKIKYFIESDNGKDILTVIIVVLVGLGSFGIGRLSKDSTSSGVQISYENQEASVIRSTESTTPKTPNSNIVQKTSQNYFASKRGQKYYSIGCSAGKTIKEENRIYFSSSTEAEQSGYELSSSCK